MKNVWFIRHGEAEHNARRIYGDVDSNLTERGRQQLVEAAQQLKRLENAITTIIASPMARTKESAHIIADELGLSRSQIKWDDRIRELKIGRFAGISHDPKVRLQRDQQFLTKNNTMGVEWIGDLVARIESFVADLRQRPEDTILIVGHNASGRMLWRILGGQDHTKPMQKLKNAEIIQLYPYVEADPKAEKIL